MAKTFFEPQSEKIADLKPHPRNYVVHPDDQIKHLMQSIKEHGMYRNVVVAKDNTILAGHGVVEAARKLKMKEIPVIKLKLEPDSPTALKILTGDNEVRHLAEIDDRALSVILKDIRDFNPQDGLLGTGFDDKMLAALVMVTRNRGEIGDINEAAEWLGMPEFGEKDGQLKITVLFQNENDRKSFVDKLDLKIKTKKTESAWLTWWPFKKQDDLGSVRFTTQGEQPKKKRAAKK